MNILIVDNNIHINSYPQGLMIRAHLGIPSPYQVRVKKITALNNNDLDADRIILTGSTAYIREQKKWMDEERKYIDHWMKKETPILGICFGAQLLARHLFGEHTIEALPYPINGSILMHQTKSSPLFTGLPESFGVIATHYDCFTIPEQYSLARVDEWPHYAFEYPGNIFGIQFHPELSGPLGHFWVRLQRTLYDRTVYQDFSVATSPSQGKLLFKNFLTLPQ